MNKLLEKIFGIKIIRKELYDLYTKRVISYNTQYSDLTRQDIYDMVYFHCQGIRTVNETADYIYNLIQEDNKRKLGDSNE